MRDNDSALASSPLQDFRIGFPVETSLKRRDSVNIRQTQAQAAQNVVVEILINKDAQHQETLR